jgi:SMI1-KNR4 cell-wall
MPITQLLSLIPAPEKPTEVGAKRAWATFERTLGVKLPRDYHEFVTHYGSGLLANFIRVFNPYSNDEYISLIPSINRICAIRRQLKELEWDEEVPFLIFPESPGIMPCGNDENGNTLYWLTDGEPDEWTIVLGAGRSRNWERFDFDLTSFLCKALTKKIRSRIWPRGFPDSKKDMIFEPYV